MRFKLITSKGVTYDDDVYEVVVPASGGNIAILDNHTPIISPVIAGLISIRKLMSDQIPLQIVTSGGLVEVDGKTTRLLADDVAAEEDLNESDVLAAVEQAKMMVKDAPSRTSLDEARRQLQYSNLRLSVARGRKKRA